MLEQHIINFVGLVVSDGRLWSDQRRFSLHALRDLGFGRGGSERIVREEVNSVTVIELKEVLANTVYTKYIQEFLLYEFRLIYLVNCEQNIYPLRAGGPFVRRVGAPVGDRGERHR